MSNIRRPQENQPRARTLALLVAFGVMSACSVTGASSEPNDDAPPGPSANAGAGKGGTSNNAAAASGGRATSGGSTAKGGSNTGGSTNPGTGGSSSGAGAGSGTGIKTDRKLVWREEFEGAQGSGPNPNVWRYEEGTGDGGWGNGELQFYTNRRKNSYLDGNGNLVIEAHAEQYSGSAYTSARLHTRDRFSRLHGRFEARIKTPLGGKGVWPAFWLLGNGIGSVGWPECGEIDIMEQRGSAPHINVGSAHGPEFFANDAWTRSYTLPNEQVFSSDFHIFAIEWETTQVRWEVDDKIYHSMTRADLDTNGKRWVFDDPMFILLNVAVGGKFDGDPAPNTQFPQKMLVDYVRVYE